MKRLVLPLLLISFFPLQVNALQLKSGDIILESLYCSLCSLIEAEEKTPFSHMGVLVFSQGNWNVLESWEKVRITPLTTFLSRRKKDSLALVLRPHSNQIKVKLDANSLLNRFDNGFNGLSYDSEFLWNNSDTRGEKLYCSEFVTKFLAPFLVNSVPTKPMHYEMNRDEWLQYFHGNPPDGAPGNSPGDFERSPLFNHVGTL